MEEYICDCKKYCRHKSGEPPFKPECNFKGECEYKKEDKKMEELKSTYTINTDTMRGCMVRAYCTKENEHKIVDPVLIEAMITEIKNECCHG